MAELTSLTDAVNKLLRTIGEAPLSELSENLPTDALTALNEVEACNREAQLKLWDFQVEHEVPLTRDANNYLQLPANTLMVDVDPSVHPGVNVKYRNGRLYDIDNRTYEFTKDLKVTIAYLLDFEDTPEVFRNYVAIKAARRFAATFSDRTIVGYTDRDEQDALAILEDHELETGDYTFITPTDLSRHYRYIV